MDPYGQQQVYPNLYQGGNPMPYNPNPNPNNPTVIMMWLFAILHYLYQICQIYEIIDWIIAFYSSLIGFIFSFSYAIYWIALLSFRDFIGTFWHKLTVLNISLNVNLLMFIR